MNLQVQTQAQAPVPGTPGWAMLRTLAGIAILSGLLVVLVYEFTRPIIAENERLLTERAVFQVLPGATRKADFLLTDQGLVHADSGGGGVRLFAAYREDGSLRGVAFPASARGYQDVIQFMFGYDPDCECVIGSKVLRSTETPGLGDKISTDPEFLENFVALDVRLNDARDALANPIVLVKQGTKKAAWEIDGISGSTISAAAMARAVHEAAQRILPRLQRDLSLLKAHEPKS